MRTQQTIISKTSYLFFFFISTYCMMLGQHGGNAINEKSISPHYVHKVANTSRIQNNNSFLISSNVLLLAPADRYIAVLGIMQEGKSIQTCNEIIEKRIANFIQGLKKIGIKEEAIFIDAITQNRIYSYELQEQKNVVKEVLKGFEIKKNILISYTENSLFDQILKLAAKEQIYDLIKVDYIVDNSDEIYKTLYKEALGVVAAKKKMYLELSEKQYLGNPEIIKFEKDKIQPIEVYRTYTAHASNQISVEGYNSYSNLKKITARRVSTHYFEAAPSANFDKVINEHKLEPCVQFILHLELRYDGF